MLIDEANKLEVKWETEVSPARPYYHGTNIVMALGQKEGYDKQKIAKVISRKYSFLPSEIIILDIKEKGANSSQD